MKLYLAPLEGITGYIYRNALENVFGGVDKYFTPFIDARVKRSLKSKELRDILPENNQGINLVPQIMTNDSEAFLKTIDQMKQFGYEEFNLNLGCPSGTVVAKGRGSGFLAKPDELQRFFEEIFVRDDFKLSVKTRIGKERPEEMEQLLEIYNQFPLSELIVHPRVQTDFYKNTPNLEVFDKVLEGSNAPVCYNGDINTIADYETLHERYQEIEKKDGTPGLDCMMLGRGILRNPALARIIKGQLPATKKELLEFHHQVYQEYQDFLCGENPILHKMKEFWFYFFENFAEYERYAKQMKKAKHLREYESIVGAIFSNLLLR